VGPALDKHVALVGFMGAGKSTLGADLAARLGRPFVDVDRELEAVTGMGIPELFREGEAFFRTKEARLTVERLRQRPPAVLALGGGALGSAQVRDALREHALALHVDVDVEDAWRRVRGSDRPLAQDELDFRMLFQKRTPVYEEAADARVRDVEAAVLAAAAVHVEAGALARLDELAPAGAAALVSDARVAGIHGADAQVALGGRSLSVHELPEGEQAKTIDAVTRLWQRLRLERGGVVVALGGGCTTDPAGFVAATYLRGVPWVAVPTTLVGQVDAAIGGKTAVNLPEGKNLVGAFHQPTDIVIDVALLATLSERQRRAALGEAVKMAALGDERLFELLEASGNAIARGDEAPVLRGEVAELVERCAMAKVDVVVGDERERGSDGRITLNLGHSLGHAVEAAAGYEGLLHGEAVAYGLRAACRIGERLGVTPPDRGARIGRLLDELGLARDPLPYALDDVLRHLATDKKHAGGRLRWVLPTADGVEGRSDVPGDVVIEAAGSLLAAGSAR
jgi:shikimate kinase / 3-dehydroquinate synthase